MPLEVERDSPKLHVFCAVSKQTVYGPFIFKAQTVTGRRYLEMLTNWLIHNQLLRDMTTFFSKMGGHRTGISLSTRFSTSTCQTGGLTTLDKMTRCSASVPPRSPDLTVCDFFLWGYMKDRVYVPQLPATVDELQERITVAVNSVTPDMLQRVWSELDYRIDIC